MLAFDADKRGPVGRRPLLRVGAPDEIDVAVAALPAGSDPGELARSDPDALRAAVAEAKPFLQFRLERILDAADLATAEGRAKAADTALVAVAEHPDNLVRDQYVMQVAERCRLEPLLLRERLEQLRREGPRPPSAGTGRAGLAAAPGPAGGGAASPDAGPANRGSGSPMSRAGTTTGSTAPADRRTQAAGAGRDQVGVGADRSVGEFRPGLEALRLAIHRPDDVATGWRRCCSVTSCSGPPSRRWSTPPTCTRPSTPPRPTCGPCWCGSPWKSPPATPTTWCCSWSGTRPAASFT